MDGRTFGQRENSIPTHKHSLRGGGITRALISLRAADLCLYFSHMQRTRFYHGAALYKPEIEAIHVIQAVICHEYRKSLQANRFKNLFATKGSGAVA